jgi:hypothetical protein
MDEPLPARGLTLVSTARILMAHDVLFLKLRRATPSLQPFANCIITTVLTIYL